MQIQIFLLKFSVCVPNTGDDDVMYLTRIWHAPSYYVQLCQPKCQIYEKTEYFEYVTTVLKPNLFYLITLSGINNIILQRKVEDKIWDEARQRHITEKLRNFGTWNCGTLQ